MHRVRSRIGHETPQVLVVSRRMWRESQRFGRALGGVEQQPGLDGVHLAGRREKSEELRTASHPHHAHNARVAAHRAQKGQTM